MTHHIDYKKLCKRCKIPIPKSRQKTRLCSHCELKSRGGTIGGRT